MNKIVNATAAASLSTSSYVTPTAEPVGVSMEGVLCTSGSIEGWQESTVEW